MDKRLVYNPNVDLSNYNSYQEPMNNYSQLSNNQNMSIQQPIPQMQQPIPQMQQPLPPAHPYESPKKYKFEKMNNRSGGKIMSDICSLSSLKKIFIVTILYVIISHNKTSMLLCNNIPYICITNALSYNILKGVIMSIMVVIFWHLM